MFDPNERGDPLGFAGFVSYLNLPVTLNAEELADADVAIIGAPTDLGTTGQPGARFGPRAIREASWPPGHHHLSTGTRPFDVLKVIDYGDVHVTPTDPAATEEAVQRTVAEVLDTDTFPMVLGGDHAIAYPDIKAVATRYGPVGVVHFDSHTDTDPDLFGVTECSHGTPFYRLVDEGLVDSTRYVQVGLRGWWPTADEFSWQEERGIKSLFMDEVVERGIKDVVGEAIAHAEGGPVFLSIDIDSLDPAFAPNTGTPEPGGLTTQQLLWAARTIASELELRGADVVEVLPRQLGTADITALAAERVVREILAGLALRRTDRDGA